MPRPGLLPEPLHYRIAEAAAAAEIVSICNSLTAVPVLVVALPD